MSLSDTKTRKKVHFYVTYIMGEMYGTPICFFHTAFWRSESRGIHPDGCYWTVVYLPKPCDYIPGKYNYKIFATMILYQFLFNRFHTESDERIEAKIHNFSLGPGELLSYMDLLNRFPEFLHGNMKPSKEPLDDIHFLPMSKRMSKSPGYYQIRRMSDRDFQFLINIVYEYDMIHKAHILTDENSDNFIKIRYCKSKSNVHIARCKYACNRAESQARRYFCNENRENPIPFAEYMRVYDHNGFILKALDESD